MINKKTREILNDFLREKIGISYDEFELLNFDEQQKLIAECRKKQKTNHKEVRVMIGDGVFIRTGNTPEKSNNRLEDRFDNVIYNKHTSYVKKLIRKLKK